ncbi:5-demethoxyubiquinol-8 5-hydroxylase UbiM [Coralloluteibacterium thermophilus]|uniref:5-demethoxyubiquinol-8 5-hydroxylase UbiM n=1 Tax=Coralloluteibacterium thermophilum TaxID=2707049 RepID=A0ABV9NJ08_9GAMM
MSAAASPRVADGAAPDAGACSAEVVVVGAGPAGLSLAAALGSAGLEVLVVEAQAAAALAEPAPDGREIALTHASRALLEGLGIWERLPQDDIHPLRDAQVLDGPDGARLRVGAGGTGAEQLGWLVPNHRIRAAAWEAVAACPRVRVLDGCRVADATLEGGLRQVRLEDGRVLRAPLLVAADSRFSATRRQLGIGARMRDFGRSMVLCRVALARPHEDVAWEWFDYGQTLALLPLSGQRASAVLTLPHEAAAALSALEGEALGAALTARFHGRFGDMRPLGPCHAYPLVGVYADRFDAPRAALVGDAAVGMHPVTAHGFNFGLQGQARLARRVVAAHRAGGDVGAPALLAAYAAEHRRATLPLFLATNLVASLYTDTRAPARLLRDLAVRGAARMAPFRRALARHLTQVPRDG